MKDEIFEIACFFGHETDAAVQITDLASGGGGGVSLSKNEIMHKNPDGSGNIVMTRGRAAKKGLL